MVICIMKGYEKYYSNFDVKPPGIYFESYGPIRLIGAEYKLNTYLSLTEYNNKYAGLG